MSQARVEGELDTLPKLLLRDYKNWGRSKVAMRRKDFGIWQEYTWEDYYEKVKYFSLGLMSLGFQAGEKISIIGDNDPEWVWSELAAQAAGGIATGIFVDSVPDEVKYIVQHSDSTFVVARDQEQVDKILQIKEECPLVKKVIYWDHKGMWDYKDIPFVMSFDEVVEQGKKYGQEHPGLFENSVENTEAEDVCFMCYTSGTTGLAKAALLSYRNVITSSDGQNVYNPMCDTDAIVSAAALAWIGGQWIDIAMPLSKGVAVNYPEEPETLQEDLREIGPQFQVYSGRLWESIVSDIQARMLDAGGLRRLMYELSLPVGYKIAEMKFKRQIPNWFWRVLNWFCYFVAFRGLKDRIGLKNTKYCYNGGAAVGPDAFLFLHALGINLKQLYGSSETGCLVSTHYGNDIEGDTVGIPLPSVEIRIADNREILARGPNIFLGYYKDPEETALKRTHGWFHSGDAGQINDDGHIVYIDRVPDLKRLKGGEWFSPLYIEQKLKFSPYIKDAIVLGSEDSDYVSAIIQIDFNIVGNWAENHHIPYTTFLDLSQKPEIYNLTLRDIERVNKSLPEKTRVRKYVHLHKEFDPDEAELTRTKKLRRSFVEERYRDLVQALYGEKNEFEIEAPVKYRDGRVGVTKALIKPISVQ